MNPYQHHHQCSYDPLEDLTPEELRMVSSNKKQDLQSDETVTSSVSPQPTIGTALKQASSTNVPDPKKIVGGTRGNTSNSVINTRSNFIKARRGRAGEILESSSSTISSSSNEDEEDFDEIEDRRDGKRYGNPRKHNLWKIENEGSSGQQTFLTSQIQFKNGGKRGKSRNNISTDSSTSHSAYNTLIIHQNNSSLLADTWIPASHEFSSSYGGAIIGLGTGRDNVTTKKELIGFLPSSTSISNEGRAQSHPPQSYCIQQENSGTTSSELSEIPREYLNQLTVLKHLAKEVKQDPVGGSSGSSLLRSESFSKSQPDLTQLSSNQSITSVPTEDGTVSSNLGAASSTNLSATGAVLNQRKKKNKQGSGKENTSKIVVQQQYNPHSNQSSSSNQTQGNDDVIPSVQILEILMRENASLNAELVNAKKKIAMIHILEDKLEQLHASHQALSERSERRESLERTARAKLDTEVKRLAAVNRELLSSGSLQNLSPTPGTSNVVAAATEIELLKRELLKKDTTIAQLLSQNKELADVKEKQDVELSAQRATLAEQRSYINILDNALTKAQGKVLQLEKEKQQDHQRILSNLQFSEKRAGEQTELKRSSGQTEGDSSNVNNNAGISSGSNSSLNTPSTKQSFTRTALPQLNARSTVSSFQAPPSYINSKYENNTDSTESQIQQLQENLKISEEQIHQLNSQVNKWEHIFSNNVDLRSGDMHGGSMNKNRGPVSNSIPNTPTSWTNSNSRGGTPHFFGGGIGNVLSNKSTIPDELLSHNRVHSHTGSRGNELEWKVKDLESRIMEKDAMIRYLQSAGMQNIPGSNIGGSGGSVSPSVGGGVGPLSVSSNHSSMSVPSYRESPSYSQASTIGLNMTNSNVQSSFGNNSYHSSQLEPPSYANLPLKLRLGGSGSSLAKNSNESLQFGSVTGGTSPIVTSGLGSTQSSSSLVGSSGSKSIDDQLKELDNQLLSKEGCGTIGNLKMQSGLCCIPGFPNSGIATRKGKVSKSLLESLNTATAPVTACASLAATDASSHGGLSTSQQPRKLSSCSPLPPKSPCNSGSTGGNSSQDQVGRTTSGPPFAIDQTSHHHLMSPLVATTTVLSFSASVDSGLSGNPEVVNSTSSQSVEITHVDSMDKKSECNIFSPASVPMGLPPRPGVSSASVANESTSQSGKSRSLERNKSSSKPLEVYLGSGKYTPLLNSSRCRSLDRRELRVGSTSSGSVGIPSNNISLCANTATNVTQSTKTEEKKNIKSSVSSKAAFFGQLLSRRTPSPGRSGGRDEKKDGGGGSTPKLGRRFPFGSKSSSVSPQSKTASSSSGSSVGGAKGGSNNENTSLTSTAPEEQLLLDKQGRQSQRNRILNKWNSSQILEAVAEQSGSESPWSSRKGLPSPKLKKSTNSKDEGNTGDSSSGNKKWGRIVKTPFGLRYTFGSPRIAQQVDSQAEKK